MLVRFYGGTRDGLVSDSERYCAKFILFPLQLGDKWAAEKYVRDRSLYERDEHGMATQLAYRFDCIDCVVEPSESPIGGYDEDGDE